MKDRLLKQLLILSSGWWIIGYVWLKSISNLTIGDSLIHLEGWMIIEGWLVLCACVRWRSQKKRFLTMEK